MNLEATCSECGRRFFLDQIGPRPAGTDGRCPFCGHHFGRHYATLLPRAVKDAEEALGALVASLEKIIGMNPGFELDIEALVDKLKTELGYPSAAA